MKKILLLAMVGITILSSIGVNAMTESDLKNKKIDQFTGFWTDRDTQQNYYFENGELSKEKFVNVNNFKYYINADGTIIKGWKQINENWYHFSSNSGAADTGWLQDGSNWYYLNTDGTMAHDTYIGNYQLGSNGAWVK